MREVAQAGGEDAVELERRAFVEHHRIECHGLDPGVIEAPFNCEKRKIRIVLAARKTLFLHGGDRYSVDRQRGGGIVIMGRNTENLHLRTPVPSDCRWPRKPASSPAARAGPPAWRPARRGAAGRNTGSSAAHSP